MSEAPRRRWYQFGLSTMFVVVTLLALFLSIQTRWIRQRHEFLVSQAELMAKNNVDPDLLRTSINRQGGYQNYDRPLSWATSFAMMLLREPKHAELCVVAYHAGGETFKEQAEALFPEATTIRWAYIDSPNERVVTDEEWDAAFEQIESARAPLTERHSALAAGD